MNVELIIVFSSSRPICFDHMQMIYSGQDTTSLPRGNNDFYS